VAARGSRCPRRSGGVRLDGARLLRPVAAAEEEIYQVRNQSSQDPLNYPIKLNNKLAALAGVVASADPRPDAPVVRRVRHAVEALDGAARGDAPGDGRGLPALNARLAELKLAPVVPSDAEIRAPTAARVANAGDDEESTEGGERRRW
jgi:hypothetical protein